MATITDIEAVVACEVDVWPPGQYTARSVAGSNGDRLIDELTARTAHSGQRIADAIQADD
jgi:hypothetical protein